MSIESTATLENHCRHLLYARLSKNNVNTRTTKPENLKYGFCPVLKLQCMPCTHVRSSYMCVCLSCVCVQYECVLMLVFLTLKRLCALFIIIYLLCNFQHLLETSQSFCPGCLARNIRPHRTTATPHPFGSPQGAAAAAAVTAVAVAVAQRHSRISTWSLDGRFGHRRELILFDNPYLCKTNCH